MIYLTMKIVTIVMSSRIFEYIFIDTGTPLFEHNVIGDNFNNSDKQMGHANFSAHITI